MESLVHKRYTKQTLEQSLFDFFGKKVTLCNGTNDWDEDYAVDISAKFKKSELDDWVKSGKSAK